MVEKRKDASLPGQYPTQDGVDRSDHFAIILSIHVEPWEAMKEGFDWAKLQRTHPEYQSWLDQAQRDISGEFEISEFDLRHYQVGPASGGMMDNVQMIATVIQHASTMYGVVELGKWAINLARRVKHHAFDWVEDQDYESLEVGLAYPPMMLKFMVIGYLIEFHEYQPTEEVFIECLDREFHFGYTSPAHPTSGVEYLVVAPTANGSFRMKIKGNAHIVYLRQEKAGVTHLLPALPYLNDMVNGDP